MLETQQQQQQQQQQKGFLFSLSIVATADGSVSQAHPILEIGATSLFVNFSRDHMIKTNLDLGHMILCGIFWGPNRKCQLESLHRTWDTVTLKDYLVLYKCFSCINMTPS